MKYSDIVTLRSMRPAYNIQEEGLGEWKTFIANDQFNEILYSMIKAVRNNDADNHKSVWIAGTYGTGKSHAGAVLKHLFCDPVDEYLEALNRIKLLHSTGQLAGVILNNYMTKNREFELLLKSFPVTSVGEPLEGTSMVSSDDYQAAYDLTNHLIAAGREQIGIVVIREPENRCNFEIQRIRGYQAALLEHDITPSADLVFYSDFTPEGGYDVISKFLQSGKPLPEAFFCISPASAQGLYRYLYDHGIMPGKDISVFSFGSEYIAEMMSPPLAIVVNAGLKDMVKSVISEYAEHRISDKLMFRLSRKAYYTGNSLVPFFRKNGNSFSMEENIRYSED